MASINDFNTIVSVSNGYQTAETVGLNTQCLKTMTTDDDSDIRRRRPFTVETCALCVCSRAKFTYLPDTKQKQKDKLRHHRRQNQRWQSFVNNDNDSSVFCLAPPTKTNNMRLLNDARIDMAMGPRDRWTIVPPA